VPTDERQSLVTEAYLARNREFESRFLQRRVRELSVPTSFSRVPVRMQICKLIAKKRFGTTMVVSCVSVQTLPGRRITIGEDRIVEVSEEDAKCLIPSGWITLAEESSQETG
jgi:hypothetical protein